MRARWWASALVVMVLGCAKQLPCSAQCDGCCDPSGECIPSTDQTCGAAGAECVACSAPDHCFSGTCAPEPDLTPIDVTWSINGKPCPVATEREGAVRFVAGSPPSLVEVPCEPVAHLVISLPYGSPRPLYFNGLDAQGRIVLAARSTVDAKTQKTSVALVPSDGETARIRVSLPPLPEHDGVPFCQWLGINGLDYQLHAPLGGFTTITLPCDGSRDLDLLPGIWEYSTASPYLESNRSSFNVPNISGIPPVSLFASPRVGAVFATWSFSGPLINDCSRAPVTSIQLTSLDPFVGFDASVPCAPIRSERFISGLYSATAIGDGGSRFFGRCAFAIGDVDFDAGPNQTCILDRQ